jgi:hypothetical protein
VSHDLNDQTNQLCPCDNGPKYICQLLKDWAEKHKIILDFIQSGNPQQSAYVNIMIDRLDATAYRNISSKASINYSSMQHGGYGCTTMIGLLW